jgi:hypothetical protein
MVMGPQDDAPLSDRLVFWSSLEQEIIAANSGRNVIQSDSNINTSENGKLLLMVDRENLHMLNCSPLCSEKILQILEYVVI